MELDSWNSSSERTPAVDPSDLRKVWGIMSETQDTRTGTCITVFESVCSPGTDVRSVCCRARLLQVCEHLGLLSRWLSDGILDDAVINVAADFPMDKMGIGVVHEGLPLDVQEFLKRIDAESGKSNV